MAQKLSQMTWKEVQAQMSIAGDPFKIVMLGEQIRLKIANEIDLTNLAEMDNMDFALKVVIASLKQERKKLYNRQHP